jgi:mono/diheme cytochrome c family protein
MAEYKSWAETPHAKAMETLRTAPAEKIAEMAEHAGVKLEGPASEAAGCIGCHTTGYKLAGGYPAEGDSLKHDALAFVGCEGCHGPGSKHVAAPKAEKKNFINRDISEGFCVQCHTSSMSPKFDFKEYKAKGLHAVAAAKE